MAWTRPRLLPPAADLGIEGWCPVLSEIPCRLGAGPPIYGLVSGEPVPAWSPTGLDPPQRRACPLASWLGGGVPLPLSYSFVPFYDLPETPASWAGSLTAPRPRPSGRGASQPNSPTVCSRCVSAHRDAPGASDVSRRRQAPDHSSLPLLFRVQVEAPFGLAALVSAPQAPDTSVHGPACPASAPHPSRRCRSTHRLPGRIVCPWDRSQSSPPAYAQS